MTKEIMDRPALRKLLGKKSLVGAEIGVQRGLNAERILKTLHIKKLYLIDPYEAFVEKGSVSNETVNRWLAEAKGKLKKWEKRLIWVRKKAVDGVEDIPDGELDFIYHDGSHTYENVKKELELYEQKVKPGGLIAGHDYNKKGVMTAVNERFGEEVTIDIHVRKKMGRKIVKDWWIWKPEEIKDES